MNYQEKSKNELINELEVLKQEFEAFKTSFKKDHAEREKMEFSLRERMKELRCHNEIAAILSNAKLTLDDVVDKIIQIIPDSMQFPEIAGVSIKIHDKVFKTQNFAKSKHTLRQQISSDLKIVGHLEVSYAEALMPPAKPVFLPEEADLLFLVAQRIGGFIEKMERENTLIENHTTLQKIIETINDVIYEISADNVIKYVSPSVEKLVGYKPDELIGESFLKFVYQPDLLIVLESFALLPGIVFPYIEYRFVAKNGSLCWIRSSASVIYDNGKMAGVTGSITNITHQKQIETELEKSESLYRSILNASPDVITITDLEGKVLFASPKSLEMFGYDNVESFHGRSILEFIKPEFREKAIHDLTKMHHDFVAGTEEYVAIRQDESTFYVEINGEFVRDEHGKPHKMIFVTRDISDRKIAEEKLRLSEERFRNLIESIKDVIYEIDSNGSIKYVSPSIFQIIGYSQNELNGRNFLEFTHPDDRTALINALKNLQSRNYPYFEYRFIAKNGSIRWVRSSTTAVFKDGKMIGGNGSMTDITEWKKANDALAESEEKYRLMFFDNPQPMIIYDIETLDFLEVNEAAIKQYGYSRAEFLQLSIKDLHTPEDFATVIEDVELSKNNQNSMSEWKHYGKDKTQFFVELTAHTVIFKGRKARHVLINDITARKQAEEALQQSSQKWKAIISASPDGIGMISIDGKIQLVSDKLALMYGYSIAEIDEFIGKSVVDFIDPSCHNMMKENIQKFLSGAINHQISEYLAIKKDGSRFNAELNSTVLYDSDGKPANILYVQRDITDRKQAGKALQSSEERFRAISEYSFSSICILNTAGKIIWVNDAMLKMTGYSSEQVYSAESFTTFLAPESVEFVITNFMKFVNHQEYKHHYQFAVIRADGEKRLCEKFMSHYEDQSGKLNLIVSMTDITERHQAEQALHANRQELITANNQLEMAQQIGHTGSWLFDIETQKIWGSAEAMRLFGFDKNEEYFTLEAIEACIHDRDRVHQALVDLISKDIPYDLEYEIHPADGSGPRTILSKARVEKDQSGKIISIIGVIQDNTERKEAEDALKTSEDKYRKDLILLNSILESPMDIIIFALDKNYCYTAFTKYHKDTIYNIWGAEIQIGMNFLDIITSDNDRKNAKANFDRAFNGENFILTEEYGDETIRRTFYENYYNAVKDSNNDIVGVSVFVIDATQRKLSEKKLIKSEERFSQVVAQSHGVVWEVNCEGLYTFVSPIAQSIYGYSAEQMVGKMHFYDKYPEDQKEQFKEAAFEVFRKKQSFNNFFSHIYKPDGKEVYISTNGIPMLDEQGNLTGYRGIDTDVTERKQAEEALKKSEDDLNYAQEIAGMGSWELNLITNKLTWSRNNYRLTGLNPFENQAADEFTTKMVHPDDLPVLNEKIQSVLTNKKAVTMDIRIIMPDGQIVWIQNNIVPVFADDSIVALKGVNIDITAKKLAEEELKQQNQRLQAIINTLPDLVFVFDKDGIYREFYCSTPELLLIPPEQIIGISLTQIFDKEPAQMHIEKIHECITSKKIIMYEYSTGNLEMAEHFEARMAPFGEDRVLTLVRDITQRKQAEQEIRDLNENLETRIIERTIQLEETNEILQNEIHSRMLVETELALEKHRLSEIIEGTNVGTWEWNIQTGKTIFNERWAEIIGYTLDEISPASIETWAKFSHPDDLKLSGEILEKHFKGELAYYSFESRMKHKNGEWVWVLDRGKVHDWDMDHKPLLMSGTHQDITESKRAQEFEAELLQLSLQLTGIPVSEIAPALNMALQRIGGFLGADRAYIFELNAAENTVTNTFEWCNQGINPEIENLKDVPLKGLPKWMGLLLKHEHIIIQSVNDLPEDWVAERVHFAEQGIQSLISIPIIIDNTLIGFVGLDSVMNKRVYKDSEINILKVWGNMLASLINHQRKEEFIEQTRRNYETFFNTIDDFLFVLDVQGNIIHTNTTVSRRLGYSTDELIEKSVLMVHPAERREEAGRIVGEMLAGSSEFCPVPLVTKSGEYIPVETRVKHGFWDGKTAIFGVTKDISKIKLSEEKFSKAFQSNSALMAIADIEGRFLDVNDSFLKTLGFSRDELIGSNVIPPNLFEDQKFVDTINEKIKQGIPVREIESKVKTKSGEVRIGLFSADTIFIGKDMCLLTMMVDITERKQAEEKIKQARDEAEKANRAKSEFLSRMSHELRTPMNSILGFAQLMEMGDLNPSQKKGVKHILNSGKHLLDLINEVLDISRIEAGRITLSMEPIHVGGIIMEMLDIMHPNAAKLNLKTELQNSPVNKLFVVADYQRLKQVLLNLLANAFKYNNAGGSVTVRTELMQKPEPEISTIRISISDTGKGIHAEDLHKLFQPFERIGAEKGETEGTGLGLTVVKKLMEIMGGTIGVKSQPGQGSTFWIELPLAESQKSLAEHTEWAVKPEERVIRKAGTILYIEDNVSNIELVEQILAIQRPGNRLIANLTGGQAVSLAIEYKPDLILLDLDLPDIHGSEVLKNLQAEPKTNAIPVIIISADAMPDRIEKLTSAGIRDYLTKPLDIVGFLRVIDEYIK